MTADGSATAVVVLEEAPVPSFLDSSIDLRKLHRELAKVSKAAIEVLLQCLESKDERTRMAAATKLLEFQVTVSKEINADQMQRLIAEIKINRNGKGRTKELEAGEGEGEARPVVDFSTIRKID